MDQLFKDKLDHYQSKVPQSAWQGVEVRLMEEQGKSKPYFWIILIAIVLLTLGYFFYMDFFVEKDQEPVELENNAIASLAAYPGFFKVNYYEKEEDSAFFNQHHFGGIESYITKENYTSDELKNSLNDQKASLPSVFISNNAATNLNIDQSVVQSPLLSSFTSFVNVNRDLNVAWPDINDHCYANASHYFFAELNAGIDFPFQKLGIQHFASENQQYLSQRSGTEFGSVSYNISLLAGYMHPVGLLAKTGIQYAQLNEKFNFVKQSIVQIQTQITIDTMFKQDGSYVIHRDTTTTEIMGEEKLTSNNRFSMLDVPLIFGYRYTGSKFSLEFNTGLIFNLMNYSSGRIFDENIQPTYYGLNGNGNFNPFKTRVGLSAYAGIRYMTGFYGRTQFYIEPNFRYYFNSFSNNDYPLSQKYLVMGISSGLKYFF